MNSDEFWCRAFLAAMGGSYVDPAGTGVDHECSAEYCAAAADAATEIASKRGRLDAAKAPDARPASKIVGFTAEHDGDMWTLRGRDLDGGITVHSEQLTYPLAGGVVAHITWSEVNGRPIPFEVRLVKRGA